MEDSTWEQRIQAITHIVTNPTTTPTLHSQLFISNLIPCYLNWDYPPILCTKNAGVPKNAGVLTRWRLSLFLKRVSRFGIPETSWRCQCPYQQPPPLILAKGVEEARWDEAAKREYVRKRTSRKRLGITLNPWMVTIISTILSFTPLLWDPFPGKL